MLAASDEPSGSKNDHALSSFTQGTSKHCRMKRSFCSHSLETRKSWRSVKEMKACWSPPCAPWRSKSPLIGEVHEVLHVEAQGKALHVLPSAVLEPHQVQSRRSLGVEHR